MRYKKSAVVVMTLLRQKWKNKLYCSMKPNITNNYSILQNACLSTRLPRAGPKYKITRTDSLNTTSLPQEIFFKLWESYLLIVMMT